MSLENRGKGPTGIDDSIVGTDQESMAGDPQDKAAPLRREVIGGARTGPAVPSYVTTSDAITGGIAEYARDHSRYFSLDPSAGKARFSAQDRQVSYSRDQIDFTLPGGSRHTVRGGKVTDSFAQATIRRVPHLHVRHAGAEETRDH